MCHTARTSSSGSSVDQRGLSPKYESKVESLLFLGVGVRAGAGEKKPGAGSATLRVINYEKCEKNRYDC